MAGRFAWAFPALALLGGAGAAYAVLTSCGRAGDPPQPATSVHAQPSSGAEGEPNAKVLGGSVVDPSDGGGTNHLALPADAFVDDAAPVDPEAGPLLGAAHFMTHVFERPDYSAPRIGYLRAGAKVAVKDGLPGQAVKRIHSPACKAGWVAIAPRGYVCLEKGGGSLNIEQPNVRLATAPPDFEGLLPYRYGFVYRNGMPLYRKVPSPKEWLLYESWLRPKKKEEPKPDDNPYADEPSVPDAGVAVEDDAAPWWERDAGKGTISLKDTMEAEGMVARRMAKGFAIAIDRTFPWNGRNWHRTTMGLVVPADGVTLVKASEFKGVELGGDWQLPVAWSLVREAPIFESKDRKTFSARDRLPRQQAIRLLSSSDPGYAEVKSGGYTYVPTANGMWMRTRDITRVDVVAPPPDLKPDEKWIDVSIGGQTLVAYEGTKPVFATLVSTGKDGTDRKGKFATVQGSYRVREKHVAATMDGDTAGELYSIDDVPYVQYFHNAYALHGAFWHSDYGRVRSHGCVNLSPSDAKRVFMWTDPQLPKGWHAVWASESEPGTRVITHP